MSEDHQYFTEEYSEDAIGLENEENVNPNILFNHELFLQMVCNYPAIYNMQSKGYSNKTLKENAYQNVARSMQCTVDYCKKRFKSLREKYHREKQKAAVLGRSGAPGIQLPKWSLMSFFEFMFDNVTPRTTSSSPLGNTASNITASNTFPPSHSTVPSPIPSPSSHVDENVEETISTPSRFNVKQFSRRGVKRAVESNPVVGMLDILTSSIDAVAYSSERPTDKLAKFSTYITAELRELPPVITEEFIDETLIRLLQLKRAHRKTT